jgi:DHA1 family tetracycline resistance protein-like MFS transporter
MLMTSTFAAFTAETAPFYMPGAPFLLALILTLIAIALFMRHRTSGDATK